MRALIGIWKIWNIGRFMSDSPLQGLWRCRSPPALVLRQLYGRNHCMWSVRQSAAAETPVRNFCCKVIESKSGLRVYPNLSVAQGMIRNQSMNTASFGDKNSFFFIEKQPDYDCRQLYLNTLTISLSGVWETAFLHDSSRCRISGEMVCPDVLEMLLVDAVVEHQL